MTEIAAERRGFKLQHQSEHLAAAAKSSTIFPWKVLVALIVAMAKEGDSPPMYLVAYQQAKQFALGTHPFSKYGSPLLLLGDALLTSLIISKISCKPPFLFNSQYT